MDTGTVTDVDKAALQQLRELLDGIRVAMLTTVSPDGTLHSRPMVATEVDRNGDVWFYTDGGTSKVDDIGRSPRVGVTWSRPARQRYASSSGTCTVVHDRVKLAELWSPAFRAWFPQGMEDPRLVLLRVRLEEVDYWDTGAGGVAQAVGVVKALVRGEPLEPVSHAQGRIVLRAAAPAEPEHANASPNGGTRRANGSRAVAPAANNGGGTRARAARATTGERKGRKPSGG